MRAVDQLVSTVFSGLSPLVIEEVTDGGGWIRIAAWRPRELRAAFRTLR